MYAFKNAVYLTLGIAITLFGAILMTGSVAVLGFVLVILGITMSTFAAYQMGQSTKGGNRG
jgi:hypothetical protein